MLKAGERWVLLINCISSLISTAKHCDFCCFRKYKKNLSMNGTSYSRVERKFKYKTNIINFWETDSEFPLDISSYPFSVEQSGIGNLFLIG